MSEEVHWLRLKVGIIFAILSTIMYWVLSLFLWPFVAYARQNTYWALPIAILLFIIYSYFVGCHVNFILGGSNCRVRISFRSSCIDICFTINIYIQKHM